MTACHCATVSPSSVPNSLRVRRVGIVSRLLLQDTTGTQGNTCCGIHLYLKKYISIVFQLKGKNKLYKEKGKKNPKMCFLFRFHKISPTRWLASDPPSLTWWFPWMVMVPKGRPLKPLVPTCGVFHFERESLRVPLQFAHDVG